MTNEEIKMKMEELMITHNENEYPDIKCEIMFAGNRYRMGVNYAYLNYCLDEIFHKYNLPYDETWMWTKSLTAKTASSEMTKIVKRLFNLQLDKLLVDDIMYDLTNLVSKVINLLDSGNRVSLDLSLVGIAKDVLTKPEVRDLLTKEHVNEDMLPEEIVKKREELLEEIKRCHIYGVSELLEAGSGVKSDQVFNCLIGLWLRTRIQNMDDVAPVFLPERWIDGIKTRESHFIESNNNRMAAIASKDVIRDSGRENKEAGTLSQDIYINAEDCGSIHGVKVLVRDNNDLQNLIYKYQIMPDKTLRIINSEDTFLIGQTIEVRSVFKCNCKAGICATCFGAHNVWNRHTKLYRQDLGSNFTKVYVSNASQEVLSFKHTVTPDVIPVRFDIVNMRTGELTHDWKTFIDRKFNRITVKEGYKAYIKPKDVTNTVIFNKKINAETGDIKYVDTEYDERDIIRVKRIFLFKDGTEYEMTMYATVTKTHTKERRIDFKIKGVEKFNTKEYKENHIIDLADKKIIQIIPNRSKTSRFYNLKGLYNSESSILNSNVKDKEKKKIIALDSIEHMVERAREILPDAHMVAIEVLFKNKVRAMSTNKDFRQLPDWTKPDANENYVILSEGKALNALNSLTVKLGLGYFDNRLKDEFYYDPNNIAPSTYDILFDSSDEINARNKYEEADDIEEVDFMLSSDEY